MTHYPVRPMALALTWLAIASCSDTGTEPEEAVAPTSTTPALAAASNSWITRANMPSTERSGLATAVVTNAAGQSILYAIGGRTATGGSLSKVQAYNVATNTWTTRAPLPIPLYWTNGVGVIGGKLYVSGGIASYKNYRAELYMYDPATNIWTRKQDMPNTTFRGVTGVVNNRLYVLTGCDQEDCYSYSQVAFYRYDPVTDQWTTLPTPPRYHNWGFGGVIGGKFYVTGTFRELDVYDPATNQWTTRASMPRRRWLGAGAALGGKLYVIGGYQEDPDGTIRVVRTTSVYDPATDTWTNKAPMPTARSGLAASRVVLNGQPRIEVVGGSRPGNNLAYVPEPQVESPRARQPWYTALSGEEAPMQHRRLLPLLLPLLVLAACGEDEPPTAPTSPGGPAFAHTAGHRVVNSLADPGDGTCNAAQCTLREAIQDPGSTQISFASGLTGPITLARPTVGGGTLAIDKGLSITGPGRGIVIRRRSTDPDFRIIRIGSATVSLRNLTIRGGKADQGGGIINFGTLRLTNSTVAANSGSGIDNHGPLTLTNSVVARNSDHGIDNHNNRTLTLGNSTVAHNSGAGIVNRGGTLNLTNSTVAHNSVGGISQGRGTSTIINARIVGNSTPFDGGGIGMSNGSVTLTNSTVSGNSARSGGGINNRDGGTFTIIKSTVAGNSATDHGGGISNQALGFGRQSVLLTLTNSTVSGNSAPSGGGIFNRGFVDEAPAQLALRNSTVAHNSATQEGGGIDLSVGDLTLINSLVAQNHAPTGPDVLKGAEGSSVLARFNLIGDGTGSGITNTNGNQVGNVSPNTSPIDPRLGPLADNGGPTRTHALLQGSPAIDAASTPDCPATDQRGVPRPQGAACDIGSYERR